MEYQAYRNDSLDDYYDEEEYFEGRSNAEAFIHESVVQRPRESSLDSEGRTYDKLSQGSESIPEQVKSFIVGFQQSTMNNDSYEIYHAYEYQFNRLSEKYYPKTSWPDAESISSLVEDDPFFLVLYREMYYRHIYARLKPTLDQRFQSYENYCNLFNFILNSEGPINLEMPVIWAWDICDEFIYQYQTFCTYRSRINRLEPQEIEILEQNPHVWSSYSVLNVLYSLVQKSRMNEHLQNLNANKPDLTANDSYASKALYQNLGYFALIGLLRVHCLLGDFTLALKVLDCVELNKKTNFARVTACHYTTYYYVGFAYMMSHRYIDAIKAFSHILLYVARTGNHRQRNIQYDQVARKTDQMCALLAICLTLSPIRLDDAVHSQLREKFGDQLVKLQKSDDQSLSIIESLLAIGSPKFINPLPPDYESDSQIIEPLQHHTKVFLINVRAQLKVPLLRNNLKLYTTISLIKASQYLKIDPEDLRMDLIMYRQKSTQLRWTGETLLSGVQSPCADLDIMLDGDMIHVFESKATRKFGEFFSRNIQKYQALQDLLAQH